MEARNIVFPCVFLTVFLKITFSSLEVILAPLGTFLGRLEPILGHLGQAWDHLEAVSGGLGEPKTLIFFLFFNEFCNIKVSNKNGHLGWS